MKKMSLLVITVITVITTISAQNGEPVSDSSWIEKTGNLFYGVRLSVYADGAESRTKTLIGDTAALVTAMKDRLTSKSATMAVDVRYVSTYRKAFTGLIRESNDVLAMTGIDPQKQVQDEYAAPFLITGWTIKREGTTDPVEFTVNAQGNLRYSVNGAATKAGQLLGNALRLKNYPATGTDTDLYPLPNGVWVDATRLTILRPPNNDDPVSRSAAPAPVAPVMRTKSKKGK